MSDGQGRMNFGVVNTSPSPLAPSITATHWQSAVCINKTTDLDRTVEMPLDEGTMSTYNTPW